ncbi:MAG TPA: precorrin-6A synthase (deacetylating) [Aeromicrobium sp.]|nr:precorrin-6A synthase (deacetylating) [Aeromicrobium sp.]
MSGESVQHVRIVGIGCGHPDQLTVEAVDALKSADFVIAARKRADDPLLAARQAIVERHAPGLELVEVDDPERDRSAESTTTKDGYEGAVADWHDARAERYESVLTERTGNAVFLVWGDPAFYDSTIRIVERILDRGNLVFSWDVVPGISALQLLAARHRIVLHEVGQPILVTTGRRLREAVDGGAENILVMLSASVDLTGLDDWHVWWGANLGTDSEYLITGRAGDAASGIAAARERVKAESGWVMDVYLLRRPA